MPIDIDRAVGADLVGSSFSWSEEDIVLYNLAVGAGDPPTSPAELKYAYEAGLRAVPAYGTIPPFGMMVSIGNVDGIDIDLARILHGDQTLTVHAPIPNSGTVHQTGRVAGIYDKGKGVLIVVEVVSVLDETGEPLFTNRSGMYVRGEGGFGGDSGPPTSNQAPDRTPDHVIETPTLPQQALLYRMASGDKNPLHADPAFAVFAGFERPILHGLCTFGIVNKVVVESAMGGEPEVMDSYSARFTGHVFPGETLVTRVWDEGKRHLVMTETKEREAKVLSNAVMTKR